MRIETNRQARDQKEHTRSAVLCGVGGQGTILAANLLAQVLLGHGFDVKTSEVHGMAQRGGAVVSMVRFGSEVSSPLVPHGTADWLVATELLEALRNLDYLSGEGRMIVSRTRVDPLTVLQGAQEYPRDAEERIVELFPHATIVDARELADRSGDARAANTVLLGILSRSLPMSETEWFDVMERVVPARALEANRRAFYAGREID